MTDDEIAQRTHGLAHWAGCPDDRSQWVGEMRHYALHDGWVGTH